LFVNKSVCFEMANQQSIKVSPSERFWRRPQRMESARFVDALT
jgi:hypothetical protein